MDGSLTLFKKIYTNYISKQIRNLYMVGSVSNKHVRPTRISLFFCSFLVTCWVLKYMPWFAIFAVSTLNLYQLIFHCIQPIHLSGGRTWNLQPREIWCGLEIQLIEVCVWIIGFSRIFILFCIKMNCALENQLNKI